MSIRRLRRPDVFQPESDANPRYLTNGRRLYRVVMTRIIDGEALVELEDCATLDVWLMTSEEVASMRSVRVTSGVATRSPGQDHPAEGS